jgi:hypothetical protein
MALGTRMGVVAAVESMFIVNKGLDVRMTDKAFLIRDFRPAFMARCTVVDALQRLMAGGELSR